VTQLLDYARTHPDATIRYSASPMILTIDSNASYLSKLDSQSRVEGTFYLSSPYHPDTPGATDGAVHITSVIVWHLRPKPNLPDSSTIFKKGASSVTSWKNSAIRNLQQPSKQTTNAPTASPTTPSNSGAPKPWTCISIGSATTFSKDSS
jgi:hypothetical protein